MNLEQLKAFRDRLNIPFTNEEIENLPFIKPNYDTPEMKYLHQQRKKLFGFIPQRRCKSIENHKIPSIIEFSMLLKSSKNHMFSTTIVFVRMLSHLCKDKHIGSRIVPIIPDEARTFGMEGLFRQLGIYAPTGQLYKPVDATQVMFYKESQDGQLLQEGINETGAFCSWLACATSYSVHNKQMIPFYIFYSMFGFQRIGDLLWAAGDSRARGFVIGGTSGRTTLNGEGLQHEDGQSHMMASFISNCISYDPTFNYELIIIIHAGLKRMIHNQEDIFYYITVMNENYTHPLMPEGAEEGILKGLYKLETPKNPKKLRVQLMGSGAILLESIAAAELLNQDFQVSADIWSATSFNLLAREGHEKIRWNMLHPTEQEKIPYVTQCLKKLDAPVIVSTDYIKAYPEQIRQFVPHTFVVLGTDGFGRSDSRANLRSFFEIDRYHIVVASLKALADNNKVKRDLVIQAIKKYNLNPDKPIPGNQ